MSSDDIYSTYYEPLFCYYAWNTFPYSGKKLLGVAWVEMYKKQSKAQIEVKFLLKNQIEEKKIYHKEKNMEKSNVY